MPVVIQEIIITATVDPSGGTTGSGKSDAGKAHGPLASATDRQALVQECAEEVMRILREKAER